MPPDVVEMQRSAINRRDVDAFAALYAPDAVVIDPMHEEPLRGTQAIRKDMADFLAVFPDLEVGVGRLFADGAAHAYEASLSGTHSGPFPGPTGVISPTHRTLELPICVVAELDAAGRINAERRYYDLASLLGQLGPGQ